MQIWADGCTFGLNMSRSKLEHTDKRFLEKKKVGTSQRQHVLKNRNFKVLINTERE